jgi:hypothetical protein
MITGLSIKWNFYISFDWDIITIGFEWKNTTNMYDNNSWFISFTDREITQAYYSLIPNQELYPNEELEISFKNDEYLDFNLYAENWNYNIDFTSTLDNNNTFETANLNILLDNFNLDLALNNRNIEWNFELITKWYDYTTYESIDKSKITWVISWRTDYNNILKSLDLSYNGLNIKEDSEFLNWKFVLEWYKFDFLNTYNTDSLLSSIDIEWEYDPETIISNLDSNIEIKNKKSTLNYDTWEYEYSDDFNQIFTSKINIDNREIDWFTSFNNWDSFYFEIEHNWYYSDEKFNLENSFTISWDLLSEFNNELKWNLNFDTDYSNNKNDFYFLLNVLSWNDELINLEMENFWKRISNDDEIEVPTNTIDIDDLEIKNNYNNYYYY